MPGAASAGADALRCAANGAQSRKGPCRVLFAETRLRNAQKSVRFASFWLFRLNKLPLQIQVTTERPLQKLPPQYAFVLLPLRQPAQAPTAPSAAAAAMAA